jgi:hypothetical protein
MMSAEVTNKMNDSGAKMLKTMKRAQLGGGGMRLVPLLKARQGELETDSGPRHTGWPSLPLYKAHPHPLASVGP